MEALKIDNCNAYLQGQKDCKEGIKPMSDDPDYLRGYGRQYEWEQCLTGLQEQTDGQAERSINH